MKIIKNKKSNIYYMLLLYTTDQQRNINPTKGLKKKNEKF